MNLILLSLAVVGLSWTVTRESGPFRLFDCLREISLGYSCHYCTALQMSVFLTALNHLLYGSTLYDDVVVLGLPQALLRVFDWLKNFLEIHEYK